MLSDDERRTLELEVLILGLNAYHGDASACLVADGEIVAAAEEERFRRIKHWAGFPSEAIRYCLTEAGVGLAISTTSPSIVTRRPTCCGA